MAGEDAAMSITTTTTIINRIHKIKMLVNIPATLIAKLFQILVMKVFGVHRDVLMG